MFRARRLIIECDCEQKRFPKSFLLTEPTSAHLMRTTDRAGMRGCRCGGDSEAMRRGNSVKAGS